MTQTPEEFIQSHLAHYASENYDPQKAHEYYMRTRELKGPRSSSGMSKTQREGWKYASDQIRGKKKTELDRAKTTQQKRMVAIQRRATATRERIQKKLTAYLEKIENQTVKIPGNASPRLRKYLQEQQKKQAASAVNTSSAQMRKVGLKLRDAVSKARQSYAAETQGIRNKYEQALNTENDNIRTKVR